MRKARFSIDDEAWARACEYAKSTHRTPSELIVEALEQMQARYPKKPQAKDRDLEQLAIRVAKLLRLQVPAGTL